MKGFIHCVVALVAIVGPQLAAAQQASQPTPQSRDGVDAILAGARAAMQAGDLAAAEKLLGEAERSGVRYPMLNFGDTPAKLRRDLDAMRDQRGKAPATAKPTAGGDVAAQLGGTGNPFRAAAPAVAGPEQSDAKNAAEQSLIAARRALSVGDLAQAQQHHAQAQASGASFDSGFDSPQRVAEAIEQLAQIRELKKSPSSEGAWRQSYARFLLTQADVLASWNDLAAADRTAHEAGQLDPRAKVGGLTPALVLARIDQLRAGKSTPPAAPQQPQGDQGLAEAKEQTRQLLAASRNALRTGNLTEAEQLAAQASALGVPDEQFAPQEDRPAKLAADLTRARMELQTVAPASAELPVRQPSAAPQPSSDRYGTTKLTQFESEEIQPLPALEDEPLAAPLTGDALSMLEAGEAALRAGDRAGALESFQAAYQRRNQLDVLSQQRLQGHLQMLSVGVGGASSPRAAASGGDDLLNAASAGQTVAARQLSAEIGKRQSEAEKIRTKDPTKSLEILREARKMVEDSQLDAGMQQQLLRRVDMSLSETERYIKDHKSELELNATNKAILDDIERERIVKVQVQQRIATQVNECNKLMDEHRYAEAEVIAKRLYDMAPDDLVVQQLWLHSKTVRRLRQQEEYRNQKEDGFVRVMEDIHKTAGEALVDSTSPITYGSSWDDIVKRKGADSGQDRRSEREIEIERKLQTPVLPKYTDAPLSQVVEGLSELAGINIVLDPLGMSQEGVRTDTEVTLNLPQEISLKSALKLILTPLHLTYTIKNEVLQITSDQIAAGDRKVRVYDVADLVIPIPNFVPTNNIGLQGLLNDAYAAMGYGPGGGMMGGGPVAVVAGNRPGQVAGPLKNGVLAQQFGAPGSPGNAMSGSGPGGLGGAASADFDSLIDLITSTVAHDSWMENGTGEGEIQPFPTNLSLVISQTQPVHEQIADLLEQLRRLQDLQVTIEVRFIRLTDSFFERIGVDFDFNIEDGTGLSTNPNRPGAIFTGSSFEPPRASATVGISGTPAGPNPEFTVDLDMPFRQGSFGITRPQFGQPSDDAGGSFGFAILSDIEAFFVINAAQGDRRANVLQAPKVTLFNGQQGLVVDSAFVPFVISVIPVVGEFAAAQQPVIVVLSEGTMMSVQAVVSNDRKYVRLTLVPFFSSIGEVREFTFEGSESVSTSSNTTDANDDGGNENNQQSETRTRSGTTVQLPTFQVISVSTTVSVPDGGTVLLGGIKRLREGRNEFGIPLLSKLPYIDRLFRNVGIGRETDSLMMMVTPHIIIQEEEEERLGINTP